MTIRYKRPGYLCRVVWLPPAGGFVAYPPRTRRPGIDLMAAILASLHWGTR